MSGLDFSIACNAGAADNTKEKSSVPIFGFGILSNYDKGDIQVMGGKLQQSARVRAYTNQDTVGSGVLPWAARVAASP